LASIAIADPNAFIIVGGRFDVIGCETGRRQTVSEAPGEVGMITGAFIERRKRVDHRAPGGGAFHLWFSE
jgi:hypothetical protein